MDSDYPSRDQQPRGSPPTGQGGPPYRYAQGYGPPQQYTLSHQPHQPIVSSPRQQGQGHFLHPSPRQQMPRPQQQQQQQQHFMSQQQQFMSQQHQYMPQQHQYMPQQHQYMPQQQQQQHTPRQQQQQQIPHMSPRRSGEMIRQEICEMPLYPQETTMPAMAMAYPVSPMRTMPLPENINADAPPQSSTPVPSSTASVTTGPMAPSAPSSVFGSLFKQKHHKRKTSSVLGWDSDDDEEVDRAQAEALGGSPAQQPVSYNEKSHWLRKQDRKQKNMRNCLCLGVILCFLILGTILAFTFKEQIFHKPRTVSRPGQNGPDAESDALLQKNHGSIESTFHVNKTIAPNPLLSKVFYGIDYTPSGAQEPDCHVNLGSVIEDIKVLSQLTTRIRLYGMACRQAEYVLRAIEYLGLQEMFVILTLWVDHDPVTWQKQTRSFWSLLDTDALMDQGDRSAARMKNRSPPTRLSRAGLRIAGISVGNEVLFRNEDSNKSGFVPIETLVGYINDIRRGISDRAAIAASATAGDPVMQALAQHLGQLPVFSSDLGRNAHQLVNSVDWVLSNIHPFFAYQSADRAADWAFTNFKGETQKVAATKPAIISEVGWPSGPATANLGPAVPSLENLQVFVDTWVCQANSRNIPYYFFEAFDEPWKNAINPRESQWGLMTADRKLKIRVPLCT